MAVESVVHGQRWYLEGIAEDRRNVRRIALTPLPFRVGRGPNQTLTLNSVNVSRAHAEITMEGGVPVVRDLGSRNGTYVNLERIAGQAVLHPGDIVHFGSCEFRVVCETASTPDAQLDTMAFYSSLPKTLTATTQLFCQMLERRAVSVHYQPVVSLSNNRRIGYEMLGRGAQPGFVSLPDELFKIAASLNIEDELSRVFRVAGLAEAVRLGNSIELFVNVHPVEVCKRRLLLDSLAAARSDRPDLNLCVELCESLVASTADLHDLQRDLEDLGVRVAYDQFRVDQTRLVEIADRPPDYLKVGRQWIAGLEEASPKRIEMLELLIRFAVESGIWTVAVGVESAAEAAAVADLGFDYAQGFQYGQPRPLADYEPE
jgi:EAL domain-containing protein (putative c-di-GMP-specific phosphodiesterase class I)